MTYWRLVFSPKQIIRAVRMHLGYCKWLAKRSSLKVVVNGSSDKVGHL